MSNVPSRVAIVALSLLLPSAIRAVDGVVLIDQNRALAGGITPGDTPGFPITISQSGTYRLTGNLTVPDANTNAFTLTAEFVTIDLNGYSIIGPTVCLPVGETVTSCSPSGGGSGVTLNFNQRGIAVVNGVVRGMGFLGIDLGTGDGHLVKNVRAESNGAGGIRLQRGTVSGCIANSNGGIGISATQSTVSGNTVILNRDYGIQANCPSSIVGNTVFVNGGGTINAGAGCVLANNAAQ